MQAACKLKTTMIVKTVAMWHAANLPHEAKHVEWWFDAYKAQVVQPGCFCVSSTLENIFAVRCVMFHVCSLAAWSCYRMGIIIQQYNMWVRSTHQQVEDGLDIMMHAVRPICDEILGRYAIHAITLM